MKQFYLLSILLLALSANAQVGIGTTTPDASAALDITSTTRGLLLPRMTAAERDLISVSPAETSLMIYCTNCGTNGEPQLFNGADWVNVVGGAAAAAMLAVGDNYQGGKIAYILVSGDIGYDPNVQHGLIAATSDQSSAIKWRNQVDLITGATGTAIGTGMANTNAIISQQGGTATTYAAGLAKAHDGGGYSDWYLPSIDELNKLNINNLVIGGFTSDYYWSSTELTSVVALSYEFNANPVNANKTNMFKVRAVRTF